MAQMHMETVNGVSAREGVQGGWNLNAGDDPWCQSQKIHPRGLISVTEEVLLLPASSIMHKMQVRNYFNGTRESFSFSRISDSQIHLGTGEGGRRISAENEDSQHTHK